MRGSSQSTKDPPVAPLNIRALPVEPGRLEQGRLYQPPDLQSLHSRATHPGLYLSY